MTTYRNESRQAIETFESCGYDFFIRMICNKKGNVRLDLYDYTNGIIYEELKYEILYTEEDENFKKSIEEKIKSLQNVLNERFNLSNQEKEAIKLEIKDKVKEKTFTYTKSYNTYNTNSWWDNYDYESYNSSYFTKNSKKKEKNEKISVEDRACDVFDTLSKEEVYEIYYHMENGGALEDFYITNLEDYDVLVEVEALIYEYVYVNYQGYVNYLCELEGEVQ